MRFVPRLLLSALWLLCMGFVVAPVARAATVLAIDHPSNDEGWLIGLLVVILLGMGMVFLRMRHAMKKKTKSGNLR